jgi:alkanesulfonate monooxygenase SsuD/methylene tetrahydromethanopterin reductase-like flavin-dependent oxidoreductase (luciferase family)
MARPLKVGIQLPEVEYEARWSELAEMVRLAEDIGLDSIWVGDHYLYRSDARSRGPWEAWTQLAAIAAITSRVEIGPLVASTSFHQPGVLAKFAATVDEISGGRLIVGLGAGWNDTEYAALGLPLDRRVSRFEEAFTIVRTLLRQGSIDFDGRFYQLRDYELVPRGPRPGGPPLLIGSNGPRMLRITMPHVQAWNAWYWWYGNRPGGLAEQQDLVDAACRDSGRDPAQVERTVAAFVRLPGATGARDFDRDSAPPIEGSPQEIADILADFAGAGVSHLQLVIDPITVAGIEALAPVLDALDADGSGAVSDHDGPSTLP